jgi:hypothetical protein
VILGCKAPELNDSLETSLDLVKKVFPDIWQKAGGGWGEGCPVPFHQDV